MWILILILMITSVYAPFLGYRLLRMAGDEKVYISQALEMEKHGRWFLQTLQGEPNYFKGPLHYILLRIGFVVFGRNPWAVLYMNFFLVIAGALAIGSIMRRRLPEWRGGDVFIGSAFALCVGIYAHTMASQMEVELASLFAIGFWCLDRIEPEDAGFAFWSVAGIVGWAKSPLHSALLGMSAVLYWILRGEFIKRLMNPRAWMAVVWGILLCLAGYAPAYFLDRQNFVSDYIIRETLGKGDTGQSWTVSIFSSFGFYLFPWLLMVLVSYLQFLTGGWLSILGESRLRRLFILSISGILPCVVFFICHPYHFENYDLPVIGAIWLLFGTIIGSLAYRRAHKRTLLTDWIWDRLYIVAIGWTAILVLGLPVGLTALASRFSPLPPWWPSWLIPFVWVCSLFSVAGILKYGVWERFRRPQGLAISICGFLWAMGAVLAVLGEREMVDLRQYLAEQNRAGRVVSLGYYNLNHNIWSEWGYLNFWVNTEVHGLHSPQALREAILRGETILVTSKENSVQDFQAWLKKEMPHAHFRWIPWKRWRTQGRTENNEPLWKAAWNQRKLSLLETDYYIVDTRGNR